MQKFHNDRQGGIAIILLGLTLFVLIIAMILMEAMRFHETYYSVETSIQRSLTAAVEMNMDYRYRADRILYLYVDNPPPVAPGAGGGYEWNLNQGQGAYVDFLDFLGEDLNASRSGTTFTRMTESGKVAYEVRINSHWGVGDEEPCGPGYAIESPKMFVSGTITMYPIFAGIGGTDPITTEFTYASNNFRVDGM